MPYCSKCGKPHDDNAHFCGYCGQSVNVAQPKVAVKPQPAPQAKKTDTGKPDPVVVQLSERLKTSAIIWIIVAVLQILAGVTAIIGILNIISAVKDLNYSKEILKNPVGIVGNFQSTTGPIIVLLYNFFLGGTIGVVGSIYYFVGIRGYVMENKNKLLDLEAQTLAGK